MAWIESHQSLKDNPKMDKLIRLLGISLPQAVGHLHLLWWWSLDNSDEGSLAGYEDCDIAGAARWEGDPHQFVDALVNCQVGKKAGFLERDEDGVLIIHDWDDYAGKLLEKRRTDAERKKEYRSRPKDVHGTSEGHPSDGAGNRTYTVPNSTKPKDNTPLPPKPEKELFGDHVLLTIDEMNSLVKNHGQEKTSEMVEMLDNYLGQNEKNRKRYTSHFYVLRKGNWVDIKWQEQHPPNKAAPPPKSDRQQFTDEDREHLRKLRERQHGPKPDREPTPTE